MSGGRCPAMDMPARKPRAGEWAGCHIGVPVGGWHTIAQGGWLTLGKAKGRLIEPALQLVAHTGFEPVISSLRGRCPRPLDECALAVCYQHVYSTLCS
jgi:hypothetical protein